MSTENELDPESLQQDINHIKQAMGLSEQYPSAFQLWLLYGTLGVLAAFGSQSVVTFELSSWGHLVSWGGFMVVGYLYEFFAKEDYEVPQDMATPNIRVQIAGVVGLFFAVLVAIDPFLADRSAIEGQAMIFGLIIAMIGAIYIVEAASLEAYQIRARDRYAFYVGGLWMLAYGAVMPNVEFLQEWGYAIFGLLFAAHGVASYLYLSD